MSVLSGWRLALRLAWRDVRRSRARSALVLFMVTFPVVAVVAADVAQATASVSSVEGLDRRIGSAEARVQAMPDTKSILQTADPDSGGISPRSAKGAQASLASIEAALGGSRPVTELRERQLGVHTAVGTLEVGATGMDVTDPLTDGLFRLTSGRLPRSAGEVDINAALAGHGFSVGDTVNLEHGASLRVVGTAESTGPRTQPLVLATLASLPPDPSDGVRTWLVGGAPVTWDQVRAVNAIGGLVLSRQVIEHPPSRAELPAQFRFDPEDRSQIYAVLVLIGVMALLEVVLLAGPAFAVGARRQSRSLALIAANGGGPAQARRVVLASAVVLGSLGAALGMVLGIVVARLLVPVLQGMQETYFGPFQLRWPHLAAIAAFGLLSALLAAVVPAWVASRQDVVAVLAGRRGDRAPSRRSPFIGLLLLALGVVGAVLGSRQGAGEFMIAGAAVVSVFGMIFLVPVVVLGAARLGRRLPLPLRYAVRDASRHRTRTVPAVAAVAATVAGVVALSIANHSDQAQAKADYTPLLPIGVSTVTINNPHADYAALTAAVTRVAPASDAHVVVGVSPRSELEVSLPERQGTLAAYAGSLSAPVLVSDGTHSAGLDLIAGELDDAQQARMVHALEHGRAVIFSDGVPSGDRVRISARWPNGRHSVRLPATFVDIGSATVPVQGVLPPTQIRRLGLETRPAGLLLAGTELTPSQESTLRESLGGLDPSTYLYVERGYQVSGPEKVVLWILFAMGAVLMLGGTLTATFLALSDARPDLATLSAVGASPRTRRGVAAAYALAVGLVGAVLGAAVGFIPGIAITYPLTRPYNGEGPSHYLDIPWLLIGGLVIGLPVFTALVVGLLARSRLPTVARLD